MGYKSIFNLQLRDERNANVEGEAAAAKAAGINYIHMPFTPTNPDNASSTRSSKKISEAGEQAGLHPLRRRQPRRRRCG